MSDLRRTRVGLDEAAVRALIEPRHGVVEERAVPLAGAPGAPEATLVGTYKFEQAEGPFDHYSREVEVSALGGGPYEVRQVVSLRIGLPYFSWLLALPLRAYLGAPTPRRRSPWWLPPDTITRRQATLLATLCGLSVAVGYLSGLLPEVMTYVAREYHVSRAGQGVDLGVVSLSSVAALPLLVWADRRGRRPLILWCTALGALLSAVGALAGSVDALTALQVLAQALLSAQFLLVGVMVVEEMPSRSRAIGLGAAGLCFGLGGGVALAVLPLAGVGVGGWRWIFALGLLGAPLAWSAARRLPETGRFTRREARGASPAPLRLPPRARRALLLLGAGALLLAVFDAPGGQFQNELLRTERHLSPVGISLLEQTAGTLGGLGTLVGARLAESWGRRRVAALGVALETTLTLASYFDHGALLWGTTALASFAAYAVAPALGVYGGEMFSTGLRSRAGGLLTVASAVGGLVGLVAVGALSSPLGGLGPALAVVAVAPLALVVLVLTRYPETAGRELEELNPEDAAPS